VAPLEGIGRQYPLSAEKLSPVLSFYPVKDWREGLAVCTRFLEFGGMGHTMAIHAKDDRVIREMALQLPAFRLVVNTPATLGSIGYTTNLFPSMSLGCGTPGGNITSDNISPMHLINIKRLAYERRTMRRSRAEPDTGSRLAGVPSEPGCPDSKSPGLRASSVLKAANPPASEISRIVDRFLAARLRSESHPATAPDVLASESAPAFSGRRGTANSAGSTKSNSRSVGAESESDTGKAAESAATRPVDFVCEQDAREAIRQGRKIYVGAKTVITPSARELGDSRELFVTIRS
jgi:acetaldehyde dehydrogenase (acetylating)